MHFSDQYLGEASLGPLIFRPSPILILRCIAADPLVKKWIKDEYEWTINGLSWWSISLFSSFRTSPDTTDVQCQELSSIGGLRVGDMWFKGCKDFKFTQVCAFFECFVVRSICAPLSRCLRSCTLVQAPADNDAGWGETPVLHILRGVNGIEADLSWKPGEDFPKDYTFCAIFEGEDSEHKILSHRHLWEIARCK